MLKYTQHYKLIKDSLFDVSRCIAPNISAKELNVLLKGTIVSDSSVRLSVLQAIEAEIDLTDLDFSEHIWLECHDYVEENAEVAENIWEENALEVDESAYEKLIPYLNSQDPESPRSCCTGVSPCNRIEPIGVRGHCIPTPVKVRIRDPTQGAREGQVWDAQEGRGSRPLGAT